MKVNSSKIFDTMYPLSCFPKETHEFLADYICPLCKGIYDQPTVVECNHVFCKLCISKSLDLVPICPICIGGSKPIDKNKVQYLLFIDQIIGKVNILCKHQNAGCEWQGEQKKLSSHIKDECLFESIRCKNPLCSFISLRPKTLEHQENCEYSPIECPNMCEMVGLTRNTLQEHYSVCQNETIFCPLGCGESFLRKMLDIHFLMCPLIMVDCIYNEFGCNEKFQRRFLQEHVSDINYAVFHSNLKLQLVYNLGSCISSQLVNMENCYNDIHKVIDDINVYYEHTFQELSTSEIISEQILPEPSVQEKHVESRQIQLNEQRYFLQEENYKTPIKRKGGFKKPLSSISSDGKKTEDSSPFAEDTWYVFQVDRLNLSKGINIQGLTVTCRINSKNEHKFAFLDYKLNKTSLRWKINIKRITGWMACGMCIKERIINNRYRFIALNHSIPHGTFMISLNGYIWNTTNPQEDNTKLENWIEIKNNQSLIFEYDHKKKELYIEVMHENCTRIEFLTKVTANPERLETLVPCVALLNYNDEIAFEKID
jgi:hypothetical protein